MQLLTNSRCPRPFLNAARGFVLLVLFAVVGGCNGADDSPTPESTTDARIVYSVQAGLTDARTLDGSAVDGRIYVFLDPSDGVTSATYTLDGEPQRLVTERPFELVGSSSGFDTTEWSDGEHELAVDVEFETADGLASERLTARFSIANEDPNNAVRDAGDDGGGTPNGDMQPEIDTDGGDAGESSTRDTGPETDADSGPIPDGGTMSGSDT